MALPRPLSLTLDAVVDELVDAGIPTTLDPTAIEVPGAWLALRRLVDFRLDGSCDASLILYLVTGDYAVPGVLDKLGELLDKATPFIGEGDVEAVTLAMPNYSPAGLPALAVPLLVEIPASTDS